MATQSDSSTVTPFGTVTKDRVIYRYRKGWFTGGSREDIPLRHVTSVALETSRHVVWGILLVIVALIAMAVGKAPGILIGIVLLALAVLILWGSPKVVLNTAGGDRRPSVGPPWTKRAAEEFVSSLRRELFKE